MRLTSTLILALLLFQSVWAQNSLLLGFGQSYERVHSQLSTYEGLVFTHREAGRQILLQFRGTEAAYAFHQGKLYQVALRKQYDKRKTAREAFEGCKNYFEAMHALVLDDSQERGDRYYVAIEGGILYEVILEEYDRKQLVLALVSRSLDAAPASEASLLGELISGK